MTSDNGSPFNSQEFNDFAKHLGFVNRKVTLYRPLANGEWAFLRTVKKVIKTAGMENKV